MRKQHGQIIRIGECWYVRYWERRNIGGTVERKRITHSLGQVTTRGKRPSADIKAEAERHMATVNSGTVPAERIVTIGDFVERVYLPWTEEHKRPSTAKGYRDIWADHLKPLCAFCMAEGCPDIPRSRLVESDRSGQAQSQHLETRQKCNQRNFHSGKAAGLFPGGKPRPRFCGQSQGSRAAGDVCLHTGGDSDNPRRALRARSDGLRSGSIHGSEAW